MEDKQILIELGIDPEQPIADIKKALEKKKQGLLRKLNAVFGNAAKEQELNRELEKVEELLIQAGIKQATGAKVMYSDDSALLSNVEMKSSFSLDQFEIKTKELSQTQVDTVEQMVDEDYARYEDARKKCFEYLDKNDVDSAYEEIAEFDPEKYTELYVLLGYIHERPNGMYTNLQRSFECYKRGAELGESACYICVGDAYLRGIGVHPDEVQAIAWYEKASQELDDGRAEERLGDLYASKKQFREMFIWYQLGIYECDNWECRNSFAKALLENNLGEFYTEKAFELLQQEMDADGEDARERRRRALQVMLEYYSTQSKQDASYRKDVLKTLCILAEERYVPIAADVGDMYISGYAEAPNLEKAKYFYDIAVENGEEVDWTQYNKYIAQARKKELEKHINDRVLTKEDAKRLVTEARKNKSKVLRIPEGYTKIESTAFDEYRGTGFLKRAFFEEVVLPESMLDVARYGFSDLKGLKRFNFPSGMIHIGYKAFSTEGGYVEELVVPGTLEEIPEWGFRGTHFGTVRIEEGVTRIGRNAFAFCHIGRLELPSTMTYLEEAENGSFYYTTIADVMIAPRKLEGLLKKQDNFKGKIQYFD